MSKTVYLVRHAQYDNPKQILVGRLPVKLSEEGIFEAEKLKQYFQDKKVSKIYSSAVERCKQTSEIISDNETPIYFDKRLLETFSAFQGYWEYDWSHFFKYTDTLGGELPEDIYQRMADFWKKEITGAESADSENILICSHGDPLYLLYTFLAEKQIPDTIQIYDLPIEDYQPKASIRAVHIKDETLKIDPILTVKEL